MRGRLASLDQLRAVAVLLVVGCHMPRLPETGTLGAELPHLLERGGWVGVDIFFVLSGFLVSGLLLREAQEHGRLRIGHFLIRRGFKIYPAFYLMILATVLFRAEVDPAALLCELFFVQNHGPALWNHTWSLAVEEHFYIGLSLLLPYLLRGRSPEEAFLRRLPRIALGFGVLCLLLRSLNSLLFAWRNTTHHFPTGLRLDALFFGVLLSCFFHFRRDAFMAFVRRWRWPLLAAGVALLVPAFVWRVDTTPWVASLGLTLFYLGGGALLCGRLADAGPPGRLGRAFAWVGSHSYSIYLWHMLIQHAFRRFEALQALPTAAYNVLYVVASIVLGWLLARLIEIPALAVRDRWWPSRSRPLKVG